MTFKRYFSTESILFNLLFAVAIVSFVYLSDASYKFFVFGFVWWPINFFFFGFGTNYSIKEDQLIITDLFFKKTAIVWSKIKQVEIVEQNQVTQFIRGSDKEAIKIVYNTYDEALVFPKNQQAFLSELQMRTNPSN